MPPTPPWASSSFQAWLESAATSALPACGGAGRADVALIMGTGHGRGVEPPRTLPGMSRASQPPCRASLSSFSPSWLKEDLSTVPPYWLSASTTLSGVTLSTMRNSADVPGFSRSRAWS